MNGNYDEILSDNPFYVELRNEFTDLFHHAISESWIICVPRIGSLNTRVFTIEDFCAHILVPSDELPETHYNTLTEKQVTVTNKVLTLEVKKGLPLQSHILFEETFYTEDYIKYKVWCIEAPLEPTANFNDNSISKEYLTSINDCIDLLWTQAAGRQVLDQIEQCVQLFLKKYPILPVAIGPLRNAVSELYTQCLQIALQNRRLREKSKMCKQVLENIKVAVESYMQHLTFDFIFKPICTSCAYEDSHLNKKIRNMSDIQLRDLDIKKELYHAVPKAKQLLSKLNSYNTVLEKVLCLKQALNAINKMDGSNSMVLLTADDLLPVFVFLVIKSGLPNWYSQFTYMKEFCFSGVGNGVGDENQFLVTTLEAVIEHIQSGALTGPPNPESYYYESDLTEENLTGKQRKSSLTESMSTSDTSNSKEETLEYIFELIKSNHCEQVQVILEKNQKHIEKVQLTDKSVFKIASDDVMASDEDDENDDGDVYKKLCHPLCNCKKCCGKLSRNLLKISPTVNSRDSHGLTPLHVACINGKATIVEALIDMGAIINATDLNECTPLHYAASRGHQNALLLLLHSGAELDKPNIDKNTPLHLAVNNGHLNCVKALIYFAEHSRKKITINCKNENGNTPLHLASKWGYEGISKMLIENGAEPSLQNHYHKTAFDYAHNFRILNVLKSSTPSLYEYIHITNSEIKELNCKTENESVLEEKVKKIKSSDCKASNTLEKLKLVERILKAISYGDVKLACFYLNINYTAYLEAMKECSGKVCHPLCECLTCKKKVKAYTTDLDVNMSDSNSFTALHYAARHGFDDLCNILLLNKANVNSTNRMGQTPLHLAALSNKASVIRLLLENCADINSLDLKGNTAFHYACDTGNIAASKALLEYKPDLGIRNSLEQSPIDIAKNKVHLTILDLIEKHTGQTIL